jgi:hypothetical protein
MQQFNSEPTCKNLSCSISRSGNLLQQRQPHEASTPKMEKVQQLGSLIRPCSTLIPNVAQQHNMAHALTSLSTNNHVEFQNRSIDVVVAGLARETLPSFAMTVAEN